MRVVTLTTPYDANGNVISEMRYKACPLTSFGMLREGEERYSSGAKQTGYGYTGQYSYVSDFGLHFYNARWYDSSLGRFAQADTIIPASQGVQGYDRYAYVSNNPLRYSDPTGHRNCEEDGYNCPDKIMRLRTYAKAGINSQNPLGIIRGRWWFIFKQKSEEPFSGIGPLK